MGYDMTLVNPDTAAQEETERLRTLMYQAAADRDAIDPDDQAAVAAAQEKVMELAGQMDVANTNYFRLNISGMHQMREDMERLGMVVWEYESKAWPEADEYGVTSEELEATYALSENERLNHPDPRLRAYLWAVHDHHSWRPEDLKGIAGHKLCSNDGWVVTPAECEEALTAYATARENTPDLVEQIRAEWGEPDSYFDAWLTFLSKARDHGGFAVW